MVLAFLKFVNNMIYKAQEEKKQMKFVAKLDLLGIFDLLREWSEKGNEDINYQILAFTMEASRITPNFEYQIEVYKHRND